MRRSDHYNSLLITYIYVMICIMNSGEQFEPGSDAKDVPSAEARHRLQSAKDILEEMHGQNPNAEISAAGFLSFVESLERMQSDTERSVAKLLVRPEAVERHQELVAHLRMECAHDRDIMEQLDPLPDTDAETIAGCIELAAKMRDLNALLYRSFNIGYESGMQDEFQSGVVEVFDRCNVLVGIETGPDDSPVRPDTKHILNSPTFIEGYCGLAEELGIETMPRDPNIHSSSVVTFI
jgi:hypothetical protein